MTHTPGPWKPREHQDFWSVCEQGKHAPISLATVGRPYTGDQEANARLIAAAPDLLAACKEWLTYIDNNGGEAAYTQRPNVAAAIAKATGKDD